MASILPTWQLNRTQMIETQTNIYKNGTFQCNEDHLHLYITYCKRSITRVQLYFDLLIWHEIWHMLHLNTRDFECNQIITLNKVKNMNCPVIVVVNHEILSSVNHRTQFAIFDFVLCMIIAFSIRSFVLLLIIVGLVLFSRCHSRSVMCYFVSGSLNSVLRKMKIE